MARVRPWKQPQAARPLTGLAAPKSDVLVTAAFASVTLGRPEASFAAGTRRRRGRFDAVESAVSGPAAGAVPGPGRSRGLDALSGALAGIAAGLPVGVLLALQRAAGEPGPGAPPAWLLDLGCAAAVGAAIGLVLGRGQLRPAAAAAGGVLIGLLGWLVWWLTLEPVLHGGVPTWSADSAARTYRELVAGLLHGGLTGVLVQGLRSLTGRKPAAVGARPAAPDRQRVVIVGGGFAGVAAARRFERLSVRPDSPDVTLISESNFLLFTPMLAEVAAGAVEPAHISVPVRAAAGHTRFRQGTVVDIDVDARTVHLTGNAGSEVVGYDHLVLAVGSVPRFPDLPGVQDHAFTLKDLGDATRLRNHVLTALERSDRADAGPERKRLLTFVVAGGGFAGTETVAELFDLVHGVSHFYPGIGRDEPRFVLVHSGDRILPELSAELGAYALDRLTARGIDFRLGVRVGRADAEEVYLTTGERIPTGTFVWTAGNRPDPLVERVGGRYARNGTLVTDSTFRVSGLDAVWAVGDCAHVPDPATDGGYFPPTAQHATRQGKVVADNVTAVLRGREPAEFRFTTLGVLVALGHRTAAAEIRGRRFSGLAAWVLWRGVYLAKLPGAEKRLRVLLDWLLDLGFPRDIVVTDPAPVDAHPAGSPAVPAGRDR